MNRIIVGAVVALAALALSPPAGAVPLGARDVRVAAEITLTEVYAGEYPTIEWDSRGANSCSLDLPDGWTAIGIDEETRGQMQVGPVKEDAAPAIECDGVRAETPVRVVPRERQGRDGVFDVSCTYSHALMDDPIKFPGKPGESHLHNFVGNRTTNAFSTTDSLIQAVLDDPNNTTCSEFQFDSSKEGIPARDGTGRWFPSVLHDGDPFHLWRIHQYYLANGNELIRPFPPGFKLISDLRDRKFKYWCDAPGHMSKDSLPRACQWKTGFHVQIEFPSCWDGVHLDTPDHMSHMAFPANGHCPFDHRFRVPRLLSEIIYSTKGNGGGRINVDDDWALSSGPLGTMHGDYMQAWDQFRLDQNVHDCSNSEARCKGFPPPGAEDPFHVVRA